MMHDDHAAGRRRVTRGTTGQPRRATSHSHPEHLFAYRRLRAVRAAKRRAAKRPSGRAAERRSGVTNVIEYCCAWALPVPHREPHYRQVTTTDNRPEIALCGVTKSFGSVHAVRGVDIGIDRGETVALLGPNGAGKSTTIDMLLGLTRPDSGTVSVFGRPPADAVAAGAIGAMLQTGSLIREISVRELVAMVASLYPRPLPVDEVLHLAGLQDVAARHTHKLSGGQTQRVRFAMALVADAELLVLDEPTVALDVQGRHEFWTAIRGVAAQQKTVLFATHYLEEADAYADRIILMADGRVVADGPATEIKSKVGVRTIRATLEDVPVDALRVLPGVVGADRRGEAITLSCTDCDSTLRALLNRYPAARDIEVRGAGLEEAFLELTATAEPRPGPGPESSAGRETTSDRAAIHLEARR
jgi:ABC-2 type transport system ATP-binding protein